MKRKLFNVIVLATFISGGVALADNNTTDSKATTVTKTTLSSTIDQSALNESKKLLEVMGMSKVYTKIVNQATEQLIKHRPMLKPVEEDIKNFYNKYIGWDSIKDDLAKVYAKYFTAEDIKKLEAFYQTPTGKKALKVMPQLMKEGRKIGMQRIISHRGELKDIIIKALKNSKASQTPATK